MNISELERLVELVNGTNICELTLRHEGARVTIRKSVYPSAAIQSEALTITQDHDGQVKDFLLDMTPDMTLESSDAPEENIMIVKSPLVGTFRHAKRPVVLAALVTEGQVLGIIEAMKLPSEVFAPGAGKVMEVFVEEGQFVEYGQDLYAIQPEN